MNENQRFRARVFKVHYELAGGDMFKPVLRTDVAARLNIADYNDDKLINAIIYLDRKGYLGSGSNITENLTVLGIDEFERGFPTLGNPGDDDDNEQSIALLTKLLEKIEAARDLAAKGLYTESELTALMVDVETSLADLMPQDTELWRRFDKEKHVTRWRAVHSGTPYISDVGSLNVWEPYIKELIDYLGGDIPQDQLIVDKGEAFTARKAIRSLLEDAKSSITLIDNYASDYEVLKILEPYKRATPGLRIKVLTGKTSDDFISDLKAFVKQYGAVEYRRSAKDTSHDRYLIIDDAQAFHSGASFKELGKASSRISKMQKDESDKIIKNFKEWWGGSSVIET